ncbi:MAG: hypothetical protein WCO44_17680 [Bacteroidota bacterium]
MRKMLMISVLIVLAVSGFAQQRGVAPLAKGQKQFNFGVGFSVDGIPLYASMDFALHKDVTLTPLVSLEVGPHFYAGAGIKADYHWNYLLGIPKKWDFYSGAHTTFYFGNSFLPYIGLQVGGRWYFNNRWALNAELGGGTGFGSTFGMSYKLK